MCTARFLATDAIATVYQCNVLPAVDLAATHAATHTADNAAHVRAITIGTRQQTKTENRFILG